MPKAVRPWRTVGFWMAAIMALAQASSALRAGLDPLAFSHYMGLPLEDGRATGFVTVYALRTGLIAGLVAYLALGSHFRLLAVMALLAVPLPLGDAYLAKAAGSDESIVWRHLAIAGFLLATTAALVRDARRQNRAT